MEDTCIMELFFARNEDAIRETDLSYGRKLYVLANKIIQCHEEAQECVNNTYWKAWENIPPRRPTYFFAYLARICRNFALNRVDWRTALKQKANAVRISEEMAGAIPAGRQGMELESHEIGRLLNRFMESISQENRLIFLRRYWYMDTVPEIAERCQLSERKVRVRLQRTRGRLHTFLEGEGIYL